MLTITRVELCDIATILIFQMKNYAKQGARIDKNNCICSLDSSLALIRQFPYFGIDSCQYIEPKPDILRTV
jgi:hypothetical protein